MITLPEAVAKYGEITNGVWTNELHFMCLLDIEELGLPWLNSQGEVPKHIYCNKDIAIPLKRALSNVATRGLAGELKTFGGCFAIRYVRGFPNVWSTHSFGISIDINPETNVLGTDGDMGDELASCFIDAGFLWGKDFSRKDPMHFSFGNW